MWHLPRSFYIFEVKCIAAVGKESVVPLSCICRLVLCSLLIKYATIVAFVFVGCPIPFNSYKVHVHAHERAVPYCCAACLPASSTSTERPMLIVQVDGRNARRRCLLSCARGDG